MMTTQTIEVEGLPEGWKPVRVKISCNISNDSSTMQCAALVVLEKIQPSRISFDEITDGTQDIDADYYIKYKWWREVKETDIPLNSDDPKLSLSLDDVNSLMRTLCEADLSLEASLLQRMRLFIKENS